MLVILESKSHFGDMKENVKSEAHFLNFKYNWLKQIYHVFLLMVFEKK